MRMLATLVMGASLMALPVAAMEGNPGNTPNPSGSQGELQDQGGQEWGGGWSRWPGLTNQGGWSRRPGGSSGGCNSCGSGGAPHGSPEQDSSDR
jgi:hypothetical protein